MPNLKPNSTNYFHTYEPNTNDLTMAMDYNLQGQPIIRTSSGTSETASDSFGRLRISSPLTLYESYHRYRDNGKVGLLTANGGTSTFNAGGWIDNTVTTTAGSKVVRETLKVFAYQPGKSLQMMISFTMASPQPNLRQRVGLFDVDNGIFFEQNDGKYYFVIRSKSSGIVQEEKVEQKDWNVDTMLGTGNSALTLDFTKSQIFWLDLEWLGVGTVRAGFVINGVFIHCHSFHHANIITGTYMVTACLPGRIEIEALGTLDTSATYKQVCFSVASEGGYEPRGRTRGVGHNLNASYEVPTQNTLYPIISIRLKSGFDGAIVIPKNFSIAPITAANYRYQIIEGTTTGGTWADVDTANSSVEYNLSATAISSTNQVYDQGYIISTNQSSLSPANQEINFRQQLQRNTLTTPKTYYEFIIAVATTATKPTIAAAIGWEEIT